MAVIAGASQYRSAATLANQQGFSPSIPTLIGAETASLLDVGRSINRIPGVGLSNSARFLNSQLIKGNQDAFNTLFSLGAGVDSTVGGATTEIAAIRAKTPQSQLSRAARGETVDETA